MTRGELGARQGKTEAEGDEDNSHRSLDCLTLTIGSVQGRKYNHFEGTDSFPGGMWEGFRLPSVILQTISLTALSVPMEAASGVSGTCPSGVTHRRDGATVFAHNCLVQPHVGG